MRSALVQLAGIFDIALALFHILFWRLFGWPERLRASGQVNGAITQVINLMLIYVFASFGVVLLVYRAAMPEIAMVMAGGFWGIRAALQPAFFGMRHPASKAITAVFLAGMIIHLIVPVIGG